MAEDVSVGFTAKGSGEILKVLQQIEKLLQSIDKSSAAMAAAFTKAANASKTLSNAANEQAKATKKAQETQQGMVDALDAVAAASDAYQESLKQQYPTLDAVIKRMSELRAQLAIIKRDGMEQTGVTREQVNAMQAEVAALNQVAQGMRQTAQETKKADKEQQKLTKTASNLFKRFVLVGVGARTAMAAILAARTEILEGFRDVYAETPEYENLVEGYERFRNSVILAIAPLEETKKLMQDIADYANKAADAVTKWGAKRGTVNEVIDDMMAAAEGNKEAELAIAGAAYAAMQGSISLDRYYEKLVEINEEFNLGVDVTGTYNQKVEETTQALDEAGVSADRFSSALDKMRSAQKKYNDEIERNRKAVSDIEGRYGAGGALGTEQISAYERQRTTRMQIEYDLGKELEKIQSEYNKRRQQIINDGLKQEKRARADANRDLKRMQEQHNLEMLYAKKRYDLTNIQNERLYQFERSRLVAEGDVIAIQELDARHELEKQAAEENFRLQQEQAEAMFKLQLKYQKQAAAEMARAIRDSMAEQLRALEENRREEEAEARAAAEEELMQNDIDFEREMEQLDKQKEEKLAAEEEAHQENLDELAEYWAEYLAENQIGLDEGLALWNNMMGLNGEMDTLIKNAYVRELQFTVNFATEWERQMGSISASTRRMVTEVTALLAQLAVAQATVNSLSGSYGGGGRGVGGGRRGSGAGVFPYQFGGDFIASQPKMIMVGEKGPERVAVRPLSPIGVGGSVGLRWQGGAIPVEGRGEMSGANLQAIGDSIAAGLVQSLSMSFARRHGIRGR